MLICVVAVRQTHTIFVYGASLLIHSSIKIASIYGIGIAFVGGYFQYRQEEEEEKKNHFHCFKSILANCSKQIKCICLDAYITL